jgi:hypothetical protein
MIDVGMMIHFFVEQEGVVETLRREHALSSQHHYKFLQGSLTFTILL